DETGMREPAGATGSLSLSTTAWRRQGSRDAGQRRIRGPVWAPQGESQLKELLDDDKLSDKYSRSELLGIPRTHRAGIDSGRWRRRRRRRRRGLRGWRGLRAWRGQRPRRG